jgi:hypothetical protein
MKKRSTLYSISLSFILVLSLVLSSFSFAQTTINSDDFESYQGFGTIPSGYGGGMKVYSTHGSASSKGLCINFSQFVTRDSTITLASPVLPAGCTFHFDYRYATYIGSFPGSGYDLTTDALEIYVAPSGSSNFGAPLLTINASNHITSVNFVNQSVDLSAFEGQSVQIKMKGIRGTSNDFWLDTDNFSIESPTITSTATSFQPETVNVFPNPANDIVNIHAGSYNHPVKVEILNMLGASVLKRTLNNVTTQLNVDELPRGIYYVKLSADGKESLKKLVLR